MKTLKPVNVLYIYGTGDEGWSRKWASSRADFIEEAGFSSDEKTTKRVKRKIIKRAEKRGTPIPFKVETDPVKIHYKSVARAIRIAQKKGWVVATVGMGDDPFTEYLRRLEKNPRNGINTKTIIDSKFRGLPEVLKEKGMKINDVFHCGHWRGGCVASKIEKNARLSAKKLANKPLYFITGPASMHWRARRNYSLPEMVRIIKKEGSAAKIPTLAVSMNQLEQVGEKDWAKKIKNVNLRTLNYLNNEYKKHKNDYENVENKIRKIHKAKKWILK